MLRKYSLLIVLIVIVIAVAFVVFPVSYLSSSNVWLGICLFPFVIFTHDRPRFNPSYFLAILMFGVLTYAYHLRIFYFLTVIFYIIFLIEFFIGRVNPLILFLTVLMSPIFLQVAVTLGFPIRLYLSQWAGNSLALVGVNIQVEGNLMVVNGFDFSVDEACMGLNMLAISMLMGVLIIAHQYIVRRQKLSIFQLSTFFLTVFVLNIMSNLFRIILIVLFKILPEDPLHDVVGIACLFVYVMLPLYFIGRWMVYRFGRSFQRSSIERPVTWNNVLFVCMLALFLAAIGFTINPGRRTSEIPYAAVTLQGTQSIHLKDGITKMVNDDLLVYVKPIPDFFSGEHTPLLCWKGSGYQFKCIRKERIGGQDVYCGILVKNEKLLHTAWWYTNGKKQTIDQFTWRREMMQGGRRFCLVNVTAQNASVLKKNLTSIFKNNLLVIQ
jgi:exosortase N